MKYIKTYENTNFKDTIDFTIWCLTQKKYAFDKDKNKWLDLKSYEYIEWEDLLTEYNAKKYNV